MIVETLVGRIRREPRRGDGDDRDEREQDQAGAPHAASPSRTRGSAAASSRSRDELPTARKNAAHRRAAGHEVDVTRAQRLEHQPAEARPRRHVLDDERSGEQRADDEAVDGADGAQRRRPGVAHDDVVLVTRRARMAASTNGWCTVSLIDCDCSRSNVAAIGSASASAGSGRCNATSASHAAHPRPSAATEDMPPTGSHPVRAARTPAGAT